MLKWICVQPNIDVAPLLIIKALWNSLFLEPFSKFYKVILKTYTQNYCHNPQNVNLKPQISSFDQTKFHLFN